MSQVLHETYFYLIWQPSLGSLSGFYIPCPQIKQILAYPILYSVPLDQASSKSSATGTARSCQGILGNSCNSFHVYSSSSRVWSSTFPDRVCWDSIRILGLESGRGSGNHTCCFTEERLLCIFEHGEVPALPREGWSCSAGSKGLQSQHFLEFSSWCFHPMFQNPRFCQPRP